MKLYTEEQMRVVYNLGFSDSNNNFGRKKDETINFFTPIELPSDEEIKKEKKLIEPYATNDYCDGFSDGINWYKNLIGKKMKEQILNQNK